LVEALFYNLPVLCFNIGGGKSIITKDTGFLIDTNKPLDEIKEDTINTLSTIIKRKSILKEKFGEKVNNYRFKFSWDSEANFYELLYQGKT